MSFKKVVDVVNPVVIDDLLIQEAIVIPVDEDAVDQVAAKHDYNPSRFHEVQSLAFSYKEILSIDNLLGLDNLIKLKLDNNSIYKIQKLDHLVKLEWLDLSFNKIEKIEGLEKLTNLKDLSLFNNFISVLEGLDTLATLTTLSIGSNRIETLDGGKLMYLREIPSIRILNLAGNPICKDADYRQYVLAHIKDLRYLDYRLVNPSDVTAARERYQDDLLLIEEKEMVAERARDQKRDAEKREAHIAEANLTGVEDCFELMFEKDPEIGKVAALDTLHPPMLEESIEEFRRMFQHATEEFCEVIFERHTLKEDEQKQFSKAIGEAKQLNTGEGIARIAEFELLKKNTVTAIGKMPADKVAERKSKLLALDQAKRDLRNSLMELEITLVEQVELLNAAYDLAYKRIVDENITTYNDHFGKCRDLEQAWLDAITASAKELMETYAQAVADKDKDDKDLGMSAGKVSIEDYDEQLKALLADKELLLGALTSSHDSHSSHLDAVEDNLLTREKGELDNIRTRLKSEEHARNRLRVSEILKLDEVNQIALDGIS